MLSMISTVDAKTQVGRILDEQASRAEADTQRRERDAALIALADAEVAASRIAEIMRKLHRVRWTSRVVNARVSEAHARRTKRGSSQ